MGGPLIGVFFHWLGGLSAASFYVPYKRIRGWSWEVFWIVGGIFAWVVFPWLFAALQTHDLIGVLARTPRETLGWCYFWGLAWGVGAMTAGLTLRYLGLSLGLAVVLGLTTVIGTLGPPIFHGTIGTVAATHSGQVTLAGILVTLIGIAIVAWAGRAKEREVPAGKQDEGVAEFDLKRGFVIALFAGVLSGCFAFGLDAGQPIRDISRAAGSGPLWQGLPVLCIVLAGGVTTNLIWCGYLMVRNGSLGELIGRDRVVDTHLMGTSTHSDATCPSQILNYLLAAFGGLLWYFQFFFYSMGASQMGSYGFSSWTLHMSSIILFSTLWGFGLKEWSSASPRTRATVWVGIGMLMASTIVIGAGNMLAAK